MLEVINAYAWAGVATAIQLAVISSYPTCCRFLSLEENRRLSQT